MGIQILYVPTQDQQMVKKTVYLNLYTSSTRQASQESSILYKLYSREEPGRPLSHVYLGPYGSLIFSAAMSSPQLRHTPLDYVAAKFV